MKLFQSIGIFCLLAVSILITGCGGAGGAGASTVRSRLRERMSVSSVRTVAPARCVTGVDCASAGSPGMSAYDHGWISQAASKKAASSGNISEWGFGRGAPEGGEKASGQR